MDAHLRSRLDPPAQELGFFARWRIKQFQRPGGIDGENQIVEDIRLPLVVNGDGILASFYPFNLRIQVHFAIYAVRKPGDVLLSPAFWPVPLESGLGIENPMVLQYRKQQFGRK